MMRTPIGFTVVAMTLLGLGGCKTFTAPDWTKGWMESKPEVKESAYAKPVRLAVMWSPAMLNSEGKKPTRGFGGRIYFYDAANKAIPVEGQLVVFAYNDKKPGGDSKSPDRKYAFTPEQFTQHYSPTELGASYSVWIPWDEVGGEQVEVSLVPVFTATSGQLVVGQSSKNLLPGPTTVNTPLAFDHLSVSSAEMAARQAAGIYGVQQASFQQPAFVPQQTEPRTLQETSIRLPSTLAQQMANAGPQSPIGKTSANPAQQLPTSPVSTAAAKDMAAMADLLRLQAAAQGMSDPTAMPGGAPRQPSPSHQPLTRFVRPIHPAPSSLEPRPGHGLPPTQPYPSAPQYGLPSSLATGR
jgi:hypothetical protein